MTSAWPVSPVQTSLYVGFFTFPPAYPETTFDTPFKRWKIASVHQKHPLPKVASASSVFAADSLFIAVGFSEFLSCPQDKPANSIITGNRIPDFIRFAVLTQQGTKMVS